jgi:hypothetical protein
MLKPDEENDQPQHAEGAPQAVLKPVMASLGNDLGNAPGSEDVDGDRHHLETKGVTVSYFFCEPAARSGESRRPLKRPWALFSSSPLRSGRDRPSRQPTQRRTTNPTFTTRPKSPQTKTTAARAKGRHYPPGTKL